jgi:succinylglutamate desuccinylase
MITDPFDNFLEALEEFVDAQDDAWIEEENCNYKQANQIRERRSAPAKERMRKAFDLAVRQAINNYPAVQKTLYMED